MSATTENPNDPSAPLAPDEEPGLLVTVTPSIHDGKGSAAAEPIKSRKDWEDPSQTPGGRFYITDIIVEAKEQSEDEEDYSEDEDEYGEEEYNEGEREVLRLTFLYTWGVEISLEQSSPIMWKYTDLVTIPLDIAGLTIMVDFGDSIAYGQLTEDDLGSIRGNIALKYRLKLDLTSMEDSQLGTVSMEISAAQRDEHAKDKSCDRPLIQLFGTTRQAQEDQWMEVHGSNQGDNTASYHLFTALCLISDNYPHKGKLLVNLGDSLWAIFEHSNGQRDKDQSILAFREALKSSPDNNGDLAAQLGYCSYKCYTETGSIADLAEAISFQRQAVELTAQEHPDLPARLNTLGNGLHSLFEQNGDMSHLSEAISFQRQAVQITPQGHPNLPGRLYDLGIVLHSLFEQNGDMSYLSEAIAVQRQGVQLTPEGHPDLPSRLNNLGVTLQRLFEQNRVMSHVSEAIAVQRQAVQLTPEGHPDLPSKLYNLGITLQSLFEQNGVMSHLSEAISLKRQAVQITPQGHPDLPGRLYDLGIALHSLFEQNGDMSHLSEAIAVQRQAVQLTPEGHPDLPSSLNNLGITLQSLFRQNGVMSHLSEAISFWRQAVELTPQEHPDLPGRLYDLGIALHSLFEQNGDMSHLSEAISFHRQAVELTPQEHPDLPAWLNNLGIALQRLFEQNGVMSHLSEATSFKRQAVELTPQGHPDLPARLNNLGNALRSLFEQNGDMSYLSEAISFHRQAVELTPQEHPDLPAFLTNLGNALHGLFKQNGVMSDLSEAISFHRQAVELTLPGHPDLPALLSNLGSALHGLFEKNGVLSHLSEATSFRRQAVQITPQGHPDLPARLNSLGIALQRLFEQNGVMSHLSEAISFQRQAVQITPQGHPNLPAGLSDLGFVLQSLFKQNGVMSHLSEAISFQRRAVELTPQGHPDLPKFLTFLGCSFEMQFRQSHHPGDIISALSNYQLASTSKFGPVLEQLSAARCWVECCQLHDPAVVLNAYSIPMNLVAQVAGLEQTIQIRYQNLKKVSPFASAAATIALASSNFELALEWLEQGCCLVWNQLNQLHSPIYDLQAECPDLADQFQNISMELENAGTRQRPSFVNNDDHSTQAEKVSLANEAHNHIRLAEKREHLLEQIRTLPQFHDFLCPCKASSFLSHLPSDGPIIIINPDKEKCDVLALISGHKTPLHISLNSFTLEEGKKIHMQLAKYLGSKGIRMRDAEQAGQAVRRSEPREKESDIYNALKALWVKLVMPILEGIGYNRSTSTPSRIWWCVTGPLTFLPIHAAGIYNEEGSCISDFVVSSYIPTVSMLIDKIKESPAPAVSSRLLLVSQAKAPGLTHIPNTEKETSMVSTIMSKHGIDVLCFNGESATIANIEKKIMFYSSIHLACHGVQDTEDPVKSGFCLGDGRLELLEIMKKRILQGDLAFLSACQTSKGDLELTEEAVHLAAGMLAAGYRSVVATMWAIKDEHGPAIAEEFYKHMLENGDGLHLDGRKAAYALHHATQCLRKKLGDTEDGILAWLPYVHYGI